MKRLTLVGRRPGRGARRRARRPRRGRRRTRTRSSIVHWSNSHPMRDGLLPQMAEQFNDADHETASGRPIEIELVSCDSAVQAEGSGVAGHGLRSHARTGCEGAEPDDRDPASRRLAGRHELLPRGARWSTSPTRRASRRPGSGSSPTRRWPSAWVGPRRTSATPTSSTCGPTRGLEQRHRTAVRQAEWGNEPLLAFTNPNSSTTGRSVLDLALLDRGRQGAGRTSRSTTCNSPTSSEYVKEFQQLVDHYMPGTIPLNTKIDQGTRYGHFFLMPEDNLVNLYKGNEKATGPTERNSTVPPVKNMVMIYPKEGSALNSNPAGIVDAPWVTGRGEGRRTRVGRLPARGRTATRVHERRASARPPTSALPLRSRRSTAWIRRSRTRQSIPPSSTLPYSRRSWTRGAP